MQKQPAAASFNWEDPLLLEEQLTEDEKLIRDTARQYAQGHLMPRVLDSFRHEKFDPAIMRELGSLAFWDQRLRDMVALARIMSVMV